MFLAPAFLLGLLAIGVPLWLHRVARADPTRHPFSSLMLLEASETQRTAKRTLRYWLLLIVRILLLVVLALAFAQPFLRNELAARAAGNARLHAIVLDASLSMREGERWQRALRAAEDALREVRSSDRVMLLSADGRQVRVMHDPMPGAEAGAVRATLASLRPGLERLDYGLVMSTANGWLGSPRPPVVLHLISDLQRSAAPLRFAELEPPPQTRLVMHDVGEPRARNVYIERAALGSRDNQSLEVAIRSAGDAPEHREVVLTIDGRERARKSVDIEPRRTGPGPAAPPPASEGGPTGDLSGQVAERPVDHLGEGAVSTASPGRDRPSAPTRVVFADLAMGPGTHRIELALQPLDALPEDDHYYAVVEHVDPKALLLASRADSDEAAYLAAAAGSLTAPRLTVEQRASGMLEPGALSSSLAGYSIVIVTDVAALPEAAAAALNEYVAAGGAVLATLGDTSAETTLLQGMRIGEAQARATRIGDVESAHPVLRDATGWHAVRFFRQRRVQAADSDRVLIAYEDGAPLLIERRHGAGRLLVLTTPLDRAWSDLAIHPLFVRFIADATRYLIGPGAAAASAIVGAPVMTGLTAAGGGQIFDPQGRRVLDIGATSSADRLIPDQTGFYEIRSSRGARWLAVNVDARESDLARLPDAYVQRWQTMRLRDSQPPSASAADADARSAADGAARRAAGRSLGALLLWLAAALLIAELLLANRHLSVRREVS